jgi:hypothetical protein
MNLYDLTPTREGNAATGAYARMVSDLLDAPVVHTGEWQAMDVKGSKPHGTHELEDVTVFFDRMPDDLENIVPCIDQDWADNHYSERVSGIPFNPAPSHLSWPYAVRGNGDHIGSHHMFDHTYPERFWPKYAGRNYNLDNLPNPREGIRFDYGDLSDVVDLLVRAPLTRQAYLPVWFPEDTGAVSGQRVPCTLGYHFMVRENRLSCRYYIRSCDIYRHFSNDVYLAAMLTRWIVQEVNRRTVEALTVQYLDNQNWRPIKPGKLVMHIASLHSFVGDQKTIEKRLDTLAINGLGK